MKKRILEERVEALTTGTKDALQLLWDNVNKGQKKKLYKMPEIKALLDRYGVVVEL